MFDVAESRHTAIVNDIEAPEQNCAEHFDCTGQYELEWEQ
jgi:hypothetical protein